MKFLALLIALSNVWAQSVSGPSASVVRLKDGRLVAVRGSFANLLPPRRFILQLRPDEEPVSAAFHGSLGGVKTNLRFLVTSSDGEILSSLAAPEGRALIAFEQDHPRAVFFAATGRIVDLVTGRSIDTAGSGDAVVALGAATNESVELVTSTQGQLWLNRISLDDGVVSAQSPIEGRAPAAPWEGGWLVATDGGLRWISPSGDHRDLDLDEPATAIESAGEHTVAINGKWLLTPSWEKLLIPATGTRRMPPSRSWR